MLQPLFGNAFIAQLSGFALITLPVTLYFALSESSLHRATWGKRWQGISVVHQYGERLGLFRSLGRTALKFIPWEMAHTCIWQMNFDSGEPGILILTGFILVWVLAGIYLLTLIISPKNQTLYDKLANTTVIRS
ncbi:RDD family protein [Rhodohalobacter mucosus]|uniref:RDD family protein n=1 Tax=Rhodohalobacter mucosus TaxID=2079485 RepID=A0A316TN33_9BACT|nr:RDD family protein [Rhodohalobacter mucosus]